MNNTLKKAPAIDRFLDNMVAKSDDRRFRLFKGNSGKYVLFEFVKIKAETDDEAIEKANNIIHEHNE